MPPADRASAGTTLHPVATEPPVLAFDVGRLDRPSLAAIDAVARVVLVARRAGYRVRLRNASPAFLDLLQLCGMAGIVAPVAVEPALAPRAHATRPSPRRRTARGRPGRPDDDESVVEVKRQPEKREESLRVEEEDDPGDPVAGELEHLQ